MTRTTSGPSNLPLLLSVCLLAGLLCCCTKPPKPKPNSMPFEIVPQTKTLYPGDRQLFKARATPPPPLWGVVTNGTIQSDHTILFSTSGDALLVQGLLEGIGGVRWTFDSRMIPNTGGMVKFRLAASGPAIRVEAGPTSTVVKDENNNTVATVTHTIVSGDTYYLEAAGSSLRLFINGQISAQYDVGTPLNYPFYSFVEWVTPFVSGGPHITSPQLIGYWDVQQGNQAYNAWTIAGGTYDDNTDTWEVNFVAGNNPGQYQFTCQIAGSANQEASTSVTIPPLSIIGLTRVTIQPGDIVRFKTNYDEAQSDIVTWSATGGTFDAAHRWTAPTTPGSYTVTAAFGNQRAQIVVTIPAVITPVIRAAKPGEVIDFATNISSPTFSATAGSINSSSGIWTAPSVIGQTCVITATGGGNTATLTVKVLEELPYQPNLSIPFDFKKKVLISEAEDGTRAVRVKSAGNLSRRSFDLPFKNRDIAELKAMRTFHDKYYPEGEIIWEDKLWNERIVGVIDSELHAEYGNGGSCDIDYSFRFLEVP